MSEVTTIQLTSKPYKRHKLIAGLIVAFAIPVALATENAGLFGLMLFGGLFYWWLARLLAWWHHG